MRFILFVSLVVLGLILAFGVVSGLLVLMAFGVGWVLTRFLPFSTFEVTLLVLVAFGLLMVLVFRVGSGLANFRSFDDDEDEDWDDDEDWDEEEDEEDDEPLIRMNQPKNNYPGIPRWRQPLKSVDFTNVKPDDLCPCGSGRKYKNCHGAKARQKTSD